MKVAVIGAGIGGTAAALACARRGWEVAVYEAAPLLAEVGAGLQVSPNGMAVLKALGLEKAALAASFASQGTTLTDYRGRRVATLPNGDPQAYRLFHRADLLTLLATAMTEAGVKLHLGKTCTPEDAPDADLVVAADGLRSQFRQAIAPGEAVFTGQVAWRATIALSPAIREGGATVYMAPHRHMVLYPLRGGSLLNIVGIEERSAWTAEGWNHPGDVDQFRRVFADFERPIPGILQRVRSVRTWGLFAHPVAERWGQGNQALLGDAAHATLPFLAQGANMALEDAWALAAAVDDAGDVAGGIARYEAQRKPRCTRIVAEAAANARRFHMSGQVPRRIAHAALRAGSILAPGLVRRKFQWVHDFDVTGRG